MKHWHKLLLVLVGISYLGIAGCNTVEGAGEDVSAVGDAVSDTSRDVRD